MSVTVQAWELQYHDSFANSHKFYRVYLFPDHVVLQWGRVGAVGQFKEVRGAALNGLDPYYWAERQTSAKLGKGYEYSVQSLGWEHDTLNDLNTMFKRAARAQGQTQVVDPETNKLQREQERKEAAEREIREQEEAEELRLMLLEMAGIKNESSEPVTMQDKLASALAKAKANSEERPRD